MTQFQFRINTHQYAWAAAPSSASNSLHNKNNQSKQNNASKPRLTQLRQVMSIYQSYRKMCPDFIVNDFVTNVIKTIPVREGYKTVRVTLKNDKITDKTLTFCALTSLSVVCRKGCLVSIVDVAIKSPPKNNKLRECIPVGKLFEREAVFYNTVLVELLDFQTGEKFQGVPTLIAASLNEGEEALVLQTSGGKWVGELTQVHILTLLKEFSRFHALNFAFSKKNPNKFNEFKEVLQGGYLSTLENKETVKIIRNNLKQLLKFFSGEELTKLKKFEEDVEDFLINVLNGGDDVTVLVHGDPTTSVLFCYEKIEVNNVVSRAQLTDWQLVKFGSPILDLSLFLFTNCDDLSSVEQLLQEYHSNLGFFLKEFQCDVNDFFPFEVFQEHWKKYAKFGLALAILTFGVVSLATNKRPNANNEDSSCEEFLDGFVKEPNEEFVRRTKDLVKYCTSNGLI